MFEIIKEVNWELPLRFDWGCGNYLGLGYTGVDIRRNTLASIICDKEGWKEFPDECAVEFRSEHSLEHFNYIDALDLLRLVNRILVRGGICRIYVPSWSKVDPGFKDNAIMYIWGARDYRENFHNSQWDFLLLKMFLIMAGFEEAKIREVLYPGPNHKLPGDPLFGTLAIEVVK